MAQKTSINIKPCNIGSSEAHNRRTAEYLAHIGNQHNIISSTFSGTDKSIPGYPFNGNGKRRLIPLLFRVAYADGWDNRPYQMDSMKEIKKAGS